MVAFIANDVFQLHYQAFVTECLGLQGALRVVLDRRFFRCAHRFQHLLICCDPRQVIWTGDGFPAESDNLVRQELGMQLFVGDFGKNCYN